jgi:hypothetical protein
LVLILETGLAIVAALDPISIPSKGAFIGRVVTGIINEVKGGVAYDVAR